MDLTNIKAGEEIEVGPFVGCRFWRYRLTPLTLWSWMLNAREWLPGEPCEADKPPEMEGYHGIYGYKTMDGLHDYIGWKEPEKGVGPRPRWVHPYHGDADGIIMGTVALWGTTVIHPLGYRAHYGQPLSFTEAFGTRADEALARLRTRFGV
jgi:hypothetical protein